MKTRKGKRFLSVLLAAIMVLTALPLTALAEGPAPAKSDALITLDNAINAYESAMDGKIYADMATAYDKYMAAKQARDMYVYGGDASQDLRTAAQALTTATTEMTEDGALLRCDLCHRNGLQRCNRGFRLCQRAAVLRRQPALL